MNCEIDVQCGSAECFCMAIDEGTLLHIPVWLGNTGVYIPGSAYVDVRSVVTENIVRYA